ncbi:MAG TPA: glycosyltransferase family 4 protein [Pyrinomonadaceae bacterium]|nr:glycosyltransferase family 4 protein [Pyrinomonadaceae bacterium]
MRILYLTGGAGQMYCGSCLRDNALATELLARGHDVTLLAVYTPTLTDEPNVSQDRVFFGGISVYLEQYFPLFRRTPRWLDRVWDSSLLLRLASQRSISTSPKMLGELTVSMLKGELGFQRKEIEKLVDWLRREPRPDVVSLPYSLLLGLAKPIKEALESPICCTLQGEDLFIDGLLEPYRTEARDLIRSQLQHVDSFIAVSEYYASYMPHYLDVPAEKIRMVPLGINLNGFEVREPGRRNPFIIGFFARLAPEKGLHLLAEAYQLLRTQLGDHAIRLEVAGYLAPEYRSYLSDIQEQFEKWGLSAEFNYRGVLDREQKIAFLRGLDVMSVPATYDEPKGVFLLEAMACGVPVVQPRRGAFTEIVEKTLGGLLVEPDDPQALANGLLEIFRDQKLAEELGNNGFQGVREHYSVGQMADRALDAYSSVLNREPELKAVELAATGEG